VFRVQPMCHLGPCKGLSVWIGPEGVGAGRLGGASSRASQGKEMTVSDHGLPRSDEEGKAFPESLYRAENDQKTIRLGRIPLL